MSETSGSLHDADVRQVAELMQALERSGFDSLRIETDNIKLTLAKGAAGSVQAAPPDSKSSVKAAPVLSLPASVAAPEAVTPGQAKAAIRSSDPSLLSVISPIMGQFYRSPDPSSPPFVQVGSVVEETATVGLVEVMKVFNAVPAGVKGTIVEICIDDAQTIDIGQVLFRVRPI